MRVHLVGEAATHAADLRAHLDADVEVVALPASVAHDDAHDAELAPDDVLVSLRLRRASGPLPRVGLLHVPGAGLDGIDLDGVPDVTAVCNVYEHEGPIAEFVLANLLEWEIGAGELRRRMRTSPWSDLYRQRVPHGEVAGRRMLLVGYGRIGRAIAVRASAFGVAVHALDDFAQPDAAATLHPTGELAAQLPLADYVVLACPLTESTRGLLGGAELAAMAGHALLVNPSRAEIVEELPLYEALALHRIGGAVLDVWYRYPGADGDPDGPSSQPFLDLPNAWCTPHSSAWTRELSLRRYAVVADNVGRFIDGRPLRNVVRDPQPTRG